jgi:hypothetical protein
MSLATPASVQKLQTALHAKAKESPTFVSMRCTTRCIGRMFWYMPTNAVARSDGYLGAHEAIAKKYPIDAKKG